MKKFFTILLAVFIIASLAGCASNNASAGKKPEEAVTENHETVAPTESETESSVTEPDLDDSSLTLPEVDTPAIVEKYDNPGDDPRMIVQVNYDSRYPFAFIDQYNLIGYSSKNDSGASGANYYYYENENYIPETNSWKKYYSKPHGDEDVGNGIHIGYIDLDGWIDSFEIDYSILEVEHGKFYIGLADKTSFAFDLNGYISYYTPAGGEYGTSWDFYEVTYWSGAGATRLYATLQGEEFVLTTDTKALWIFEQAFKSLAENSAKNPW